MFTPKKSLTSIADGQMKVGHAGAHVPHDQHLREQFEHVKGDGFTSPMHKPKMPPSNVARGKRNLP